MYDGEARPLDFNTLLELASIDPADVLMIRHTPREPALKRVFPWLVTERPDLFLAYQQIQWKQAEKAMTRAKAVVAFVGLDASQGVFAGISKVGPWVSLDLAGYHAFPGNAELIGYGMTPPAPDSPNCLAFELEPMNVLQDQIGRLVVDWPPPAQTWWRWAKNGVFPVRYLLEESRFTPTIPNWENLVLTWDELSAMPRSWRASLANWRGVYFIYDRARRAGYVGSAYGADNILGRWRTYAETGHGGNVKLRQSNPKDLSFSILQRTSPDMDIESVVALEGAWKDRLHTRVSGLNAN